MKRDSLIMLLKHQTVAGAGGDARFERSSRLLARLVVFIDDNRLAKSLKDLKPVVDLINRRAIKVRSEEIAGLSDFGVDQPGAVTAGCDQQFRPTFFRHAQQARLAFRIANERMCEAAVRILVGNFEQDILPTTRADPIDDIGNTRP